MSSAGKYVRAPKSNSDLEEFGKMYGEWSSDDMEFEERQIALHEKREYKKSENQEYIQKIEKLQNTIDKLVNEMNTYRSREADQSVRSSALSDEDQSWNNAKVNPGSSAISDGIRWENIKPFPNDVPAYAMWDQWNRFIDRFEIATSLANVTDPVKRAQTLFLSMGEKLQGITRAARLRPSLTEPNCYNLFVKNIEKYLQSMVDVTAEHEMFSNLKQGIDEPTIAFHARLLEKVRLCRFSQTDQDRFIRMQLLKGMRNREVAKAARIFGYETTFIVQSATREEAYIPKLSRVAESSRAFMVSRERNRFSGNEHLPKRRNNDAGWNNPKRYRQESENHFSGEGKRFRCNKCNRLFHKSGTCPATYEECRTCGIRGHYAATCRERNATYIQKRQSSIKDRSGEKVNHRFIGANLFHTRKRN
ncbi:uncharacterized protein LOC129748910 [Uranotaenia lowii]|uniref:uncharacterized protein LOC129748910 n=1 Tax=Uranotaenia lowii TaxID=190385 RepID=UPI0024794425|nr:uncharacterized protein LOC129748910 [Uranotaenia lowii]XP_055599687.1 uncharacterized protein LOC129748910 [Uranotaenia lowii]